MLRSHSVLHIAKKQKTTQKSGFMVGLTRILR
jgi:hypothetical protein